MYALYQVRMCIREGKHAIDLSLFSLPDRSVLVGCSPEPFLMGSIDVEFRVGQKVARPLKMTFPRSALNSATRYGASLFTKNVRSGNPDMY